MKNIVIFGAPGSGKGTQSAMLAGKYSLAHISTGDVLRREIGNGTELGKVAKAYIDRGELLPDDIITGMLGNVYDGLGGDCCGVIFDGYPRTIPQAESLKAMMAERGHSIAAMIELDVPEAELVQRMLKRGAECGRSDDNEATIRERLATYAGKTAPLIEWYRGEGIHHHIDGVGEMERIFADICRVMDGL